MISASLCSRTLKLDDCLSQNMGASSSRFCNFLHFLNEFLRFQSFDARGDKRDAVHLCYGLMERRSRGLRRSHADRGGAGATEGDPEGQRGTEVEP